jgi:hypothetical protein
LRRLISLLLTTFALGASVLLLAACGSSSKTSTPTGGTTTASGPPPSAQLSKGAYRLKLKKINAQVTKSTNQIRGDAGKAKSAGDLRNALKRLGDAELRLSGEVAKLRPPSDAIKANRLLAKGFGDTANEIDALLPKIGSQKSAKAGLKLLSTLHPKGGQEVQSAVRELIKLGYTSPHGI